MLKASLCACVCIGCLVSFTVPSPAQEVIHALTGTVASINNAAGTVTILQDNNGSMGEFQEKLNPKMHVSLDKRIAADTTAADAFKNKGAYVIVFYFEGLTGDRTAVALKNLGAGPFTSAVGTLDKYDGHAHELSVKDASGAMQTFKINAGTVAETDFGAVEGTRFSAHPGDHVRVVGATVDGTQTALFVRNN